MARIIIIKIKIQQNDGLVIIYAFLLGAMMGAIVSLFGAGGGFILTPLLNIMLGLPMPLAVGTSSANVFGTATFTLVQRLKGDFAGWRVALFAAMGILPATLIGAELVAYLRHCGECTINGHFVAIAELVLLSLFFVLLLAITLWMIKDSFGRRRNEITQGVLAKYQIKPIGKFPTISGENFSIPILIMLGGFMGLLSGMLGIGGGVIMLPALLYLVGQRVKSATLTNTLLVWCASLFSTFAHWQNNNIAWNVAMPALIGGLCGTFIGVRVANKISGDRLKQYFVLIVIVAFLLVGGKLFALIAIE